jgi:hypothetical protein
MSQIHGAKGQQSQRKYDKHKMEEKKGIMHPILILSDC